MAALVPFKAGDRVLCIHSGLLLSRFGDFHSAQDVLQDGAVYTVERLSVAGAVVLEGVPNSVDAAGFNPFRFVPAP